MILNLSIRQTVDVWCDLDDAYYGHNRFGGDTAEIYGYRLMQYSPGIQFQAPGVRAYDVARAEMAEQAAESLSALLTEFCKIRAVHVEVDGLLFYGSLPPLDHRCHVRVIPKGQRT